MEQEVKKNNRSFEGEVISAKMNKTAVVLVTRTVQHKTYLKLYKISRKFKAHDEKNECHVGDIVEIRECRPVSKDKRWMVVKVVQKAK